MPIDFGPGDLYVQLYSSSPAPKRDYHGLTITSKYVILNSWDISHGPHVFPRKMRTPIEELPEDAQLQRDIKHLFGNHVLDYALQLASDEKNLQTIPNKIFLKILRLLAANDILNIGQTSKIFFEICNSNIVWKIIYRKRLKKGLTSHELLQSEKQSWRYLLKKKLTEKVQQLKSLEKKVVKFPKPNQDVLNSIARYSKPVPYKKRTPPDHMVPKDNLDLDIDFKIIEYEKNKSKIVQRKKYLTQTPSNNTLSSIMTECPKCPQKWTSTPPIASSLPPNAKIAQKAASTAQIKENPKNVVKKISSPNLVQKSSKSSSQGDRRSPKVDLSKKADSDKNKSKSSQQVKAKI